MSTIQRKDNVVAEIGFQLDTIKAPDQTPANKETNTSLVYIARTIANTGGIIDKIPKVSPEINIYLLFLSSLLCLFLKILSILYLYFNFNILNCEVKIINSHFFFYKF